MEGKCQGCDEYGEVDDIMLCDSCADELDDTEGLFDIDEEEIWPS